MLALIEEAGIDAVRAKSLALTAYAVELADELAPAPRGRPRVAARPGPARRPRHPGPPADARGDGPLWERDVIPDYRDPDGMRIGLSPLSTTFAEVGAGWRPSATTLLAVGPDP